MKSAILALVTGVVFSIGLGVSQMTDPNKVVNFIDVFGAWDPSLAFVMAGAMTTFLIGYKLILPKISKPIWGSEFHLPKRSDIDKSLVIGSAIFGIGWALSGFCPGPGITSIVTLSESSIAFVISMAVGMIIFHYGSKFKKYEDG